MDTKAQQNLSTYKRLFNIDERLAFDYVDNANMWIIGGFCPIDNWPTSLDVKWMDEAQASQNFQLFSPYITECDKSEGFRDICYFKMPLWRGGTSVDESTILAIKCMNNGTMYFSSDNVDALLSFVMFANINRVK